MFLYEFKRKKMESNSFKLALLSNLYHVNYRFYKIKSGKVLVSLHFVFDYRVFPLQDPKKVNIITFTQETSIKK